MDLRKVVQQPVDVDMTPMIDCVFLLMIFFVLVIDLNQKNLEELVLPSASFREPDDRAPENRPLLNVLQNGAVVHNGEVVFDPGRHGDDYSPLRRLLLGIRAAGLENKTFGLVREGTGDRAAERLDVPILVRADKWTEWRRVAEVMRHCSRPDVGFARVELALAERDEEQPRARR